MFDRQQKLSTGTSNPGRATTGLPALVEGATLRLVEGGDVSRHPYRSMGPAHCPTA